MPSRTSYFNKTLFWNDLKRYWPLTAGYALLWFIILPLTRLTSFNYGFGMHDAQEVCFNTLRLSAESGYWIAFFCGIMFAMAAFSYLTNPRATNGLHALPARRETLYLTHFLAGLCAQLAVQLLSILLTAAVLLSFGGCDARSMCLSLLALVLPTLFFYSFGVFCMIFAGQILAAPIFYFILNVVVVGMELLLRTLAGSFLYGWAGSFSPRLLAFSPIVNLATDGVDVYRDEIGKNPDGSGIMAQHVTFDWLLIYAAVGVVLAVLALLVYRRRHSEETGATVAVGWARPIFKYGVAFCAGLALGQLFYEIFFAQYSPNGSSSLLPMLLCMAVAGLIGYFGSEMLLKKTFRVWRSGWKGALAFVGALVLLGCVLSFDLTGYERRIPDAGEIASVEVNFASWGGNGDISGTLTDPEAVRLVTEAHRAIINDKARQQSHRSDSFPYERQTSDEATGWLRLTYVLNNGDTEAREYNNIVFYASELGDSGSVAAALNALNSCEAVALSRALQWDYKYAYGDVRAVPGLRFTGGVCQFFGGNKPYAPDEYELTAEQAEAVYEAVQRDAKAGRIAGSLFAAQPTFNGSIQLYATFRDTRSPENEIMTTDYHVILIPGMSDTIGVLRSFGIEPEFS